MSSHNDYMRGRREGMDFALRIAKDNGLAELEKEIEFRGITGCSINVSQKDIQEASKSMAENAALTAIAVSFEVMREQFFFPQSQMEKFVKEFKRIIDECVDNPGLIREYKAKADSYGIKL